MIKISDVVVENFRPDDIRKLGFGWEDLKKINPGSSTAPSADSAQDSPPEYSDGLYDMVAPGL
ncbi:MAG: CoA transferase [Syntrophaceae bacterium]|nr:CoA transferase [Syntrophaceae bacterium]